MRIEVDGGRLFFDVLGAKFVPDGFRMIERPTVIALHGGPGGDHSRPVLYDDGLLRWGQWLSIAVLRNRHQIAANSAARDRMALAAPS
jgi:hypothetical protein